MLGDRGSARVVVLFRRVDWKRLTSRLGVYLVLIVVALYILLPFYLLTVVTVKDPDTVYQRETRWLGLYPGKLSLESYINVLTKPGFHVLRYFANSLGIAVGASLVGIIVSFLAAYSLTRSHIEIPGRTLVYYLIISTMMIPLESILVGIFEVEHKIHLLNSYPGIILPLATNGVVFLILHNFLRGFPREIEDAARIDGATELQVAFQIALPLTLPVMGACCIFQFLAVWQAFVLPYILSATDTYYTLPVSMRFFESELFFKLQELLTLGMFIVIPSLLVFIIFQGFIMKGISLGAAIKG